MKPLDFLVKVTVGGVLLSLISALIPGSFKSIQEIFDPWHLLPNLMVAFVLGLIIVYSGLRRKSLMVLVFLVFFLIGYFNILIEAFIFNVTIRKETLDQIFGGVMLALLFVPAYVVIFNLGQIETVVVVI